MDIKDPGLQPGSLMSINYDLNVFKNNWKRIFKVGSVLDSSILFCARFQHIDLQGVAYSSSGFPTISSRVFVKL